MRRRPGPDGVSRGNRFAASLAKAHLSNLQMRTRRSCTPNDLDDGKVIVTLRRLP